MPAGLLFILDGSYFENIKHVTASIRYFCYTAICILAYLNNFLKFTILSVQWSATMCYAMETANG